MLLMQTHGYNCEIENGGVSLVQATDNGIGMDRRCETSFQACNHKISAAEDLNNIQTLGFRGEALASIASVTQIEMLTRQRGQYLDFNL